MFPRILCSKPLSQTSGYLCKQYFSVTSPAQTKIALVLAGSGVYDGTEVTEATSCLIQLSRAGADVSMFAPNKDQAHVIDHTKGEPSKEIRNVLTESARIARGNVADLASLDVQAFDGCIIPGGFGAAKNLCTFAFDGAQAEVDPNVAKALKGFHDAGKPLGLCCIAPVLAAKVLKGCEVTVGSDQQSEDWPFAETANAITSMGATHIKKKVTDIHVDSRNKIVTTPAYMNGTAKPHEVFDGIGEMIKAVLKLIASR